ncbi:outer membrane beta-barrel protein [Agarivorans sp. 1_MG-2023]|uniref:outer membrane beta-barrel protein n=1 Tax=Agarivorans sp. 1_MG-2023 TaxID=3062634 RepID=UPI0026E463B1|nr:outer membrane beta-barrel protein [Agarivorans sp. 1_MG-2023]MDO6762632.1 outer membrane beta-barrel protein [Agarivorans sp. 1_MG-2023]
MKKALLALSFATLFTSSAYSTEFFVGGGAGYQKVNVEASDSEYGSRATDAGRAAFHIRGGVYLNENHRLTATINYMSDANVYRNNLGGVDTQIELAQNEYLLSYDYIQPISDKFSVFGGATIGAVHNKGKFWLEEKPVGGGVSSYSHQANQTDFTYGLQIGMQYKILDNLSMDVQYRHMFESYSNDIHWETGEKTSFSLPHSNAYTISFDYRF